MAVLDATDLDSISRITSDVEHMVSSRSGWHVAAIVLHHENGDPVTLTRNDQNDLALTVPEGATHEQVH